MNLLTKLGEKFKNIKDDTKKSVLATLIAGGIALSGVGMSACENPLNPNDPGTEITNPDNKYSKYSQILQNVLTDQYYSSLINDDISYSFKLAFNHPSFQPIPYGFLEDKGFNITKIKNDELFCTSEIYSIDNDLYVELKAEIEASTNYLTNYVLKYSLTDQELSELKKLFTGVDFHLGKATYYQAPFFVQELSYLKNPEIISTAYSTISANSSAYDHFDKKKYLTNRHRAIYLGSTYKENSIIAFHTYQIRPWTTVAETTSQIATIIIGTNGYGRITVDGKYIHNAELKNSGILTDENKILFENSIKKITSYTTSSLYFQDIKTNGDFKKMLGD